jgi:DNA-binding response OmpR family regulator
MQTMTTPKSRILYVDSDAEDSFTLASMLKRANYEPVTVNFASDALQIARCEEFDLYLLSRRYPVGPGIYLCQKLHEIAPQIPIVFLAQEKELADQFPGIRSGSDEYTVRAKDTREILGAVRLALSEKKDVATAIN